MSPDSLGFWSTTGQVVLVDLLLSGDNAIVIAMAAEGVPASLRRRAVVWGTALAIGLRVALALLAAWLLHLPLLKTLAALLLLVIAVKLLLRPHVDHEASRAQRDQQRLRSAVLAMVGADLALSLDNVLAIAASSRGDALVLALGLALSVPILMFGSLGIGRLLHALPWLLPAGAAMLGWIAGAVALGDPLWADWVHAHAPQLETLLPWLTAACVPLLARGLRRQR